MWASRDADVLNHDPRKITNLEPNAAAEAMKKRLVLGSLFSLSVTYFINIFSLSVTYFKDQPWLAICGLK